MRQSRNNNAPWWAKMIANAVSAVVVTVVVIVAVGVVCAIIYYMPRGRENAYLYAIPAGR